MGLLGIPYKANKFQVGKETTYGTAVTETDILHDAIIPSNHVYQRQVRISNKAGMMGGNQVVTTGIVSKGTINGDASYEKLPVILQWILGAVTATGSDPYTREYAAPAEFDGTYDPLHYTVVFGNSPAIYKVTSAIMPSISFSINENGLQYEAPYLAQKTESGASFASLSRTNLTSILLSDATLYVDAWDGTMGATELANALYDFRHSFDPGLHNKRFNGSLLSQGFGWNPPDTPATMSLDLEFTSDVQTLVESVMSGLVQRQIKLAFANGDLEFDIEFAGTLSNEVEFWQDREGNAMVTLEFASTYNSDFGNFLQYTSVNSTETLAVNA